MAAILFQSECINNSAGAIKNFHHSYFQLEHILLWTVMMFSTMNDKNAGLILGLHPTNERRRYKVMRSLIGWVQT